ncbi:MAG: hypothetical protein QNK05_16580 [Myxococcota bacterium]|nr:hypothetical protein [Myxococcota bacterium]
MNLQRRIALGAIACLLVASAFLVVDRGGLLAWLGAVLAAGLLLKILRRPSARDALLSAGALGVWAISWGATWGYVVSTWESGEVVQLDVAGEHTARVWVLDLSGGPIMYYDAPPEVASPLLAGEAVSMTRDGRVRDACAVAARAEDLPEDRLQDLIGRMEEKYGSRNLATTVYYSVLGVKRDRVGLVIELAPCG